MKIDWKKNWKKVPGFIRHDFVRKLIAFILAGFVYLAVSQTIQLQQIQENDPPISVEVKTPNIVDNPGNSKNVKLIRSEEKNPELTMVIRESVWAKLWGEKSKAEYVLNKKKAFREKFYPGNKYRIRISKKNIIPPFGIEIISGFKYIEYEEFIEKRVKVVPVLNNSELHRDYVVEKVSVVPEKINVAGPESIIKNLKSVKTKPVRLRNITQSFDSSAGLDVPKDSRLRFSPEKVFLQVSIKENIKKREFKLQRIRIMNDSPNLRLEIIGSPHANITVSGPNDRIIALRPEQIKPYIDISNLNSPGIYSVDLGCWVAEKSIEVIKIEPQSVKVKISKK